MQWIADRIHDFTEADCQKSASEELIVSWLVHRVTFREMIELSFLECFQITIFLRSSFVTTSSVFCFLFFFFFLKCSPK